MILFDHGAYPFAWGIALLLTGQIARLHHRRPAMLLAAGAALLLLLGKRATVPAAIANQRLFPDPALLEELIFTAAVVIVLALIDRPVEQAIRKALDRTRCPLKVLRRPHYSPHAAPPTAPPILNPVDKSKPKSQ